MTTEERQERKRERKEMIPARLADTSRGVMVKIEEEFYDLELHVRDDARLTSVSAGSRWKSEGFDVTADMFALAEFIRALTVRYNREARRLNMLAEVTPQLLAIKTIGRKKGEHDG